MYSHTMSSPSFIHEGVIALVRNEPAFAASLLRDLFQIDVPHFDEARLTEAALNQLVPIEYSADAVVLFDVIYAENKPVFGTIFEVQLERKERKRYTWPLYAVAARARYECPFVVTAVTPDRAVARWASEPIDLGDGMMFRVRVIGPDGIPQVTDHEQARREPQLAVLSSVAHGNGEVDVAVSVARAAVDAISPLPEEQRLLYSLLIERSLSEGARKVLAMDAHIEKFLSEAHHQRSFDRGKAEGETKALLMILQHRGLAVSDDQRRLILACTDVATLDRWLGRALAASSVSELLA
jgi:hypothetical protein